MFSRENRKCLQCCIKTAGKGFRIHVKLTIIYYNFLDNIGKSGNCDFSIKHL